MTKQKKSENDTKENVVMIMGYPCSGKTRYSKKYVEMGYQRFNRDELGGTLDALIPKMEEAYTKGERFFVLDNTYTTKKSRSSVLKWANSHDLSVHLIWLTAPKNKKGIPNALEVSQYNTAKRMIERHKKLLEIEEIKESKEQGIYPMIALFAFKKRFEAPKKEEGFKKITPIMFEREIDRKVYKNKAIILDYDGTLRDTYSGDKFPKKPEDVKILPNRKEILSKYKDKGYKLLGVSNQSGIGKGTISEEEAKSCFERTNELLGQDIDYRFCPHSLFPMNCYCRKPAPGLGVELIEHYKLDPDQTIMVGDQTSDKTFAKRCGIQFISAEEFFGEK